MAKQITSLNPPAVDAGGPAFTLEINGTGFARTDKVFMGTRELTGVIFVSNTQLTVPMRGNLRAGRVGIKVTNASGGNASNVETFVVNAVTPPLPTPTPAPTPTSTPTPTPTPASHPAPARKPFWKSPWLWVPLAIFACIALTLGINGWLHRPAPEPGPETAGCMQTDALAKKGFEFTLEPGGSQLVTLKDGTVWNVKCPANREFDAKKDVTFAGCDEDAGYREVDGEDACELVDDNANANDNDANDNEGAPQGPIDGSSGNTNDNANDTGNAPAGDGQALAEEVWGENLPNQPEMYSAHQGEEGYPDNCAGLCWDTSKVKSRGVMRWYGPNNGEEDITESDADFGDGSMGPLELMRTGKVTKVIFYTRKEAQLEMCAIGTLDGKPLTDILGVDEGECGKRVALSAGWHVIEDNANSPIAGFGVRFSASGWAGMTESQIVQYTKYWEISGDTATWVGPDDVEIMMTPAMVSMMQDFGTLKNIVFTTKKAGRILLCNGYVDGDAHLESPDGSCQYFDVEAGTYTYHGEDRLSAGVSWQPK